MERLNNDYLGSEDVLAAEHRHRYLWAASYMGGDVLDLACGYGYGSDILQRSARLTSYVGIDASQEAIANAQRHFAGPGRQFLMASATEIPLPDDSIDGIVSLETLEHLPEPSLAVREFKRVLRPGGVLVGSVPSRYFDDLAERVYGPNPYHVTRFDADELESLLKSQFATVRMYYSALEVVTHIGSLENGRPASREVANVIREREVTDVSGSFHFVASDLPEKAIDDKHGNRVFFCTGATHLDEVKVRPLQELVRSNETLVTQKDAVIADATRLIGERDDLIKTLYEKLDTSEGQLQQLRRELDRWQPVLSAIPRPVRRFLAFLSRRKQA